MKTGNEIKDELMELNSMLAGVPRNMPYAVPDGYFENLAGAVKSTISELDKKEQVPDWGKKMPYDVPADYFKTSPADIVANAIASTLPKDTAFKAPAGYFEGLPAQMLQAAKAAGSEKKESKTIPLKPKYAFTQLRWLAAAVVVIGIGIGAYMTLFDVQQPETDKLLAMVPNNEIKDYMQGIYSRMDVDRIVTNTDVNKIQLDNSDIIQYLNETGWD